MVQSLCGPALRELELLQIMGQLVPFGDQLLCQVVPQLRKNNINNQDRLRMIDIGTGDAAL